MEYTKLENKESGYSIRSKINTMFQNLIEGAEGITSKVDKVAGKQLSTEDFTTAMKNKLNQAVTTHQLSQQLEAYAKKKGTEPNLMVGYAEKLVGTAVGGGDGPGGDGRVLGRIGTIDGTLSNFLTDIGLGCYLVTDNHDRKKLVKTNHSKRIFGNTERDASLDGSEGQYMWGWNKPFYYCVKIDDNGILLEEKFAYTPMKGYLCWKVPAATISAFNGAVIDRGEDGTKYKLVSVVNDTARYRAFDTPLNISDYTAEVNGGYGCIADSSNGRLRLQNLMLLDGYDDNWGISWDWFYYIAYALMRATLGCADVQSTTAPLTPVTSGYDIVQKPSGEKSLHFGLMASIGAPSNRTDWLTRFGGHCLYPTSAGIGEGAGDITGNVGFNGPDGARYNTAAFYGWKNPYGHMPYIKYGHKLLLLNNGKMEVATLNNKSVNTSSKLIPNPITAEQVANGYTIAGLSTEGLMGYPGSVRATGLNTYYGDAITANSSIASSTGFNQVPALIATEISDLKAGMASVHLIKENDTSVDTEKYGSVPYTIALCESDEPFNYEPIQY